jgi:hypothetical protein
MTGIKEENSEEINKKVTSLPSRSGNKAVYLVVVEDNSFKAKRRQFVSRYLDYKPIGIEVIGYEVSVEAKVFSHQDAIDEANKGSGELFNILFPWQKVLHIRNVTYTLPQ